MQNIRAALILTLFFSFTIPLMPVQFLLLRLSARAARRFPHWYHRQVCRLLNIRLHVDGTLAQDNPVLIVANHVSWLDIPVLSALAPISFVAKKEVGTWPFIRWLAQLQRTVFVDRKRRGSVGGTADEITRRLRGGDIMVLFAEGTSSDGTHVLPFQSSLFAAIKPGKGQPRSTPDTPVENTDEGIFVQTLAIAYTHIHGLPLSSRERPAVAWYGDMEMAGHAWQILKRGPIDVHIRLRAPAEMCDFADRKALSRQCETWVRADLAHLLSNARPPLKF